MSSPESGAQGGPVEQLPILGRPHDVELTANSNFAVECSSFVADVQDAQSDGVPFRVGGHEEHKTNNFRKPLDIGASVSLGAA